jgi:enoyl-[acyl-carrier protein] reductase II
MRVIKNDTTAYYEQNPGALKPFPDQLGVSYRDGTFHLGGDESTPGIDPAKEGYPAGQAVGAIDALVPAGELLISIVNDAEAILTRLAPLAGR